MGRRTDVQNRFDSSYYDEKYFSDPKGKQFRKPNGRISNWGYRNPTGEWSGCKPITEVWKDIFGLGKCNTDSGLCKVLDVGCGRGQFLTYLRDIGVEAWGFDYSSWAIQNPYQRCQRGWTLQHDAAITWPYGDYAFDLVFALDILEHIYLEDIDKVISEMYRVAKKWVFLKIATCKIGNPKEDNDKGYILKRGDEIPIELEGMVVSGRVTIQDRQFWISKLINNMGDNTFRFRGDKVSEFTAKAPHDVISDWLDNTLIVLERIE